MSPAKDDEKTLSLGWANESKLSAVVKSRYSEPLQPDTIALTTPSADGSLSPSPSMNTQIKCNWCSKNFDALEKGAESAYEALHKHLAAAHPDQQSATSFSSLDGATEKIVDEAIEADDEVNDHESPLDTTNTAIPTASATDVEDQTLEVDTLPSLGTQASQNLQTRLGDVFRPRRHAYLEDRLNAHWNIHNAPAFSADYDDETVNLDHMWDYVYQQKNKAANKNGAADKIPSRPSPYVCSKVKKGDFLPMTAVESFLEPLKNYETLPTDELHTMAANIAHALKSWQDEWMAIEKLSKTINGRSCKKPEKPVPNPRALDPPEVFRDKRESALYGYKYDPSIHDPKKFDPWKYLYKVQDPFTQGGFRPTPAQLRKMQAEAGKNNPNPDGFKTMQKFGQEFAPRFQDPPLHRFEGGMVMTRKRKVAQSEVAALRQMSGNDSATPAESDVDGRPYKRMTRSIKDLDSPQVKTAPPSPGPRGRGRGGRGGRGRGGTSRATLAGHSGLAHIASSAAVTESQSDIAVTNNSLEAGSARSRTMTSTPTSETPTTRQPSVASGQGAANIAPAPKPALAPATPGAPPALAALPPNLVQPGEVVDTDELNRRRLIAKSKNPRRTQAMLDHWKRFNSEGRTRNPKRTKAQIEADKRAESERRAHDPPKEPTKIRKRKPTSVPAANELDMTQPRANSSSGPTMSLQPAPIQPAVASFPISTAAPPISLPQPPNFSSAPPAPQSPQRHPHHNPIHPHPPTARPLPSVLPSIESSVGSSAWNNGPPRFLQYPLTHTLPGYSSYAQPPFSHPPPHPPHGGFPHPRHEHHSLADNRHPNPPPYGYDAPRPPPHIRNGPHMPQPQGERR